MSSEKQKTILVTGAAGFIGYHLCKRLLEAGFHVIGLDNMNAYYDVNLKFARLENLGIQRKDIQYNTEVKGKSNFSFIELALEDKENLPALFKVHSIAIVCNLAAQAGVRYSIENPMAYIDANVVGFMNLLECMRHHAVKKLVYASSSSVYGNSDKIPFSTNDTVDHPISLYAATKKTNELMAHTYSHLFGIQTIGLRFFTVYGPWGRPDMAMFLFTDAILNNKPIKLFNHGDLSRDFTYIDDIVAGIEATITQENPSQYALYNIGNSKPVRLLDFVLAIEKATGKEAIKENYPMQPGDVERTWADTSGLEKDYHYKPQTSIDYGVQQFVDWYKSYYNH
jgi:UDP-glucuronate 4-epimerase